MAGEKLLKNDQTGKYAIMGANGKLKPVRLLADPQGKLHLMDEDDKIIPYDGPLPQGVAAPATAPAPQPTAPPAAQTPPPSVFEGVTDAMTRGYTMGLRDPVSAAGGATGRMLADITQGREGKSWTQHYTDVRNKIANKDAAFKRNNPIVGYGTEIAASLLNPVAKAAGGYVTKGATMPRRTFRGAVTAAPLGATYAAGTARPGQEGQAAMIGGAGGLLIGGLSVPVIETALGVGRWGLQKAIDSWGGSVTSATKKITDIIMEMGGGNLQRGLEVVKQHLQAGGPETTIVDVLGEPGRRLARGAVNAQPKAGQIGDDWVNFRKATRGGRLHKAADEIAPGNFHEVLEETSNAQRIASKPLYDEAFSPQSVRNAPGEVHSNMGRPGEFVQWDSRMDDLFAEPLIKQGMAKGIRIQQIEALADDVPFNFQEYAIKGFDDAGELIIEGVPNLRAMDAAKRGLDDILEGYRDGTTGKLNLDSYGRAIERLRKSLVAKLDDITTVDGRSAYKEARRVWAGPAKLKDAAWMGRRFQRGDEEVADKVFKAMSETEQDMFLLGVRRELTKMINSDSQSALTKFDPKKLDFYIRLRNMVPEEKFAKFHAGIREELSKGKVENFVNPRANSATGGIQEDVAALNRAPNWMIQAFDYIASAKPSAAIASTIKAPINWLNNPSPTTARNLAEMLFERRPSLQAQVLDDIGTRRLAQDLMPQLSKKYATRLAALLATRSAAPSTQVEGMYYNEGNR